MIFFSHKCGQLGNRLFAFAHLIANAAARNVTIGNLSFDEYARYFQTTRQDIWCRYPAVESALKSNGLRSWLFILNKVVLKLLRKTKAFHSPIHSIVVADLPEYRFGENKYFELDSQPFQTVIKRKPVVFLFGRFFRDYYNFEKYQDVIRDFFRPTSEIQTNVCRFIEKAKRNADMVIGVHIRRGDYEQFAAGKYFYSQVEYCRKMEMLQASVPTKRMKFVICSNEPINLELFDGINFCIGPCHIVEDMYALSACDLIMGPPSTYTLWASFYGKKPLYQIKDLSRPLNLNDFLILPPALLYNFSLNEPVANDYIF